MGLLFKKEAHVVFKPAKDVDLTPASSELYLPANVKAPRLAGFLVKVFAWFLESRIFGTLLLFILKRDNLIHKLVTNAELEEPPVYVPLHPFDDKEEQDVKQVGSELSPPELVQQAIECLPVSLEKTLNGSNFSFRHWTISDYSRAYTSGEITPRTVAEHLIAAIHESSTPPLQMSFFINYKAEDILKQATESTLRYEQGVPISALDGVPIAIKDEIDCLPYPTTGGTKWMHNLRPCTDDACCVKCLRLCGAVLVGKTNMHELGAGTSGINPHYGATRNPYNRSKISGGSSSGSAAVVASGLCPVALGVDGGGSVRMPAALCGVVGLKPTFGRVPHSGVLPLNWSVGMVGILAGTVEDAFIVYAAISCQLPPRQLSVSPKVNFPLLNSTKPISSIKLAKYGEWFNDCSDDIRECCSNALERLQKQYGWKTVEVTIPEIEMMRLAHYVTIGSECTTSLSSFLEKLDFKDLGWDARVALAVYGAFSSKEYIKAQKIRNRQMQFHMNLFTQADVIVSPTVGVTAYTILDDALNTGELDYINGAALVRYSIAGNFLGLPAVTVPVGYDKSGLPIGLQLIGKPWSEATLIHMAFALQDLYVSEYRKPEVYYDLLNKNSVF
ncbi:fatty acid amide hydrolase-like isoform X2 [Prunus avium]|uniref:Fatty acid amide hydrolase-like isoform X1 n=1 Tax=Prunus avium TaxID=42229 RepID=A0A6P5T1W6_PRUAV|nr:fatty acid amide hydrolase-like isoform X1 [Prunus avium]XP_021820877.1 fatty acid amide hydrolase-like isoform X2 [Prunus avium]